MQGSLKANFNAEEWATVVSGPLYAGVRVIGAERGGTLRETMAMGRAYQEARQRHGTSELLDELVRSPAVVDQQRLQTGEVTAAFVSQQLREAISILEAKCAPSDVDDYKRFVMTVAQAVAGAHKSGGFLGIGGKQVSDAEDEALDEISIALGPPPAS